MFWDHIGVVFSVLAGSFLCWLLLMILCFTVLEEMLNRELSEEIGGLITMIFIVAVFSFLVYLTYIKPPVITTKWKKIHCGNLKFSLKEMELKEPIPAFYKSLTFPDLKCIYSLKFKSRILKSRTFLYIPKNLEIEVAK